MNRKTNIFKRIICIVIIVCCFTSIIGIPRIKTYSKVKDVTNTISGKNDIKELVQCFNTPCGYDLTQLMKKGRTKKYSFSKASDRRNILNLCYEEIYNQGVGERATSIRLFGKTTSNIDLLIGDWGCAWPEIKIKKIYKTSSYNYKIVANINWFEEEKNASKKIGSLRLYLKKDSNSYYGYIVKSMKLKKIADI